MSDKKVSIKVVQKVARSAKTAHNRLHVIARDGKWVVKKDGASRVSGIYVTKTQAVNAAKAQVNSGKINYALVHDMQGRITEKIG